MDAVKIGVVLAGGAGKGVYELGVMRALEEYFGVQSIRCVSSASIGMLVAQAFGTGRGEALEQAWKGLNKKSGSLFLSLSGKEEIHRQISEILSGERKLSYEHYVCVWNYTRHCVQYIPFHTLSGERLQQYIRGAIAVPFFSSGEWIGGERFLDGALIDNIPTYPLLAQDLDVIFCVYFDNYDYTFENPDFDRKVIKLFDFPNRKRLELLNYDLNSFDAKVQYGYDYTMRVIDGIFPGRNIHEVYDGVAQMAQCGNRTYCHRLTADVVLSNLNAAANKYVKRLTCLERKGT